MESKLLMSVNYSFSVIKIAAVSTQQVVSFIPDPKKPAHKVLLSRKNSNITHPVIYFSNILVQRANQQNHLGIILDEN